MKSKLFAIILFISIFTGIVVCPEATGLYNSEILTEPTFIEGENAKELLLNTSFETKTSETSLYGWGNLVGGTLGVNNGELVSDANSGSYGLELSCASNEYVHALQSVSNIVPGKDYELSAWVKRKADPSNAFLSIMFYSLNGYLQEVETGSRLNLSFSNAELNTWEKRIIKFTMPENICRITLLVRLMYGGEVIYDDVSLLTEDDGTGGEEPIVKKDPISGELLTNGGFETISSNKFTGWYAYGGTGGGLDGDNVTCSTTEARSGSQCVKIEDTGGGLYPWIVQTVNNMVPGAEYQLCFYIKSPGVNQINVAYTCEYNAASVASADQWLNVSDKKHQYFTQSNEWQEVLLDVKVPTEARSCGIRLRLFNENAGYFYADDVSFYMTKEPDQYWLDTDEIFYYTEWVTGTATVAEYDYYDETTGNTAVFELLDGETVLASGTEDVVDRTASFDFSVSLMADIGKEYTMRATVYDSGEQQIQVMEKPVFRYNRPTYLRADGVFEKDGTETNFVLGNGTTPNIMPYAPDVGVTVAQAVGDSSTTILQKLDLAQSLGLKAMVVLYSGEKSAGHPDRINYTRAIVNMVKDHPALLCYKLQDEPIGKGNSDEELIAAYRAVRDIDPNHPTYLDDSGFGSFRRLGLFCDIMDIDCYPAQVTNRASYISDMMTYAVEAVRGRKPVMLLQQAFTWFDYMPTADEFRHYAYQTFLAGGRGFGFHTLGSDSAGAPTLMDYTDVWAGLCDWAEWEISFMFDCFVNDEYRLMNEEKTDNIWWRTYEKDGEIYAIILNRQQSADSPALIKLTDTQRQIYVDGYTAELLAGGDTEVISGAGNVFKKTIPAFGAYLYKITPHLTDGIIENGDLEMVSDNSLVPENWSVTHSATYDGGNPVVTTPSANYYLLQDGESALSGDNSFIFTDNGDGLPRRTYLYQPLENLVEGETYRVSFSAKATEGTNFNASIHQSNVAGKATNPYEDLIAGAYTGAWNSLSSDNYTGWANISMTFNCTAAMAQAPNLPVIAFTYNGNGTVYLDKISIERVNKDNYVKDSSFEAVSHVSVVPFEWVASDSGSVLGTHYDYEFEPDGNRYLKLVGTNLSARKGVSPSLWVAYTNHNMPIHISFRAKAVVTDSGFNTASGVTGILRPGVNATWAGNGQLPVNFNIPEDNIDEWVNVDAYVLYSSDLTYFNGRIFFVQPLNAGADVYIDDVRIYADDGSVVSEGTTLSTGTVTNQNGNASWRVYSLN